MSRPWRLENGEQGTAIDYTKLHNFHRDLQAEDDLGRVRDSPCGVLSLLPYSSGTKDSFPF